jgi:hypothetical protein
MWSADEIASDDCIQLGCCPQAAPLRRDQQLITQVGPDQLRQLGWKPSQNRVCSAVCVGNMVLPGAQTSSWTTVSLKDGGTT